MVVISPAPAALSSTDLSLFHTTDDFLSNSPLLVFYGPTATTTVQASSSRIQAHIFSPAGLQSFARLIISPTAPFYSAVSCLPREEQGDEICRGLAFSLYKYFVELSAEVKDVWEKQCNTMGRLPSAPKIFSEAHAAMLAARMVKVDNVADIISDVRQSLAEQTLSWMDLDVVLPEGSIQKLENPRESAQFDETEDDVLQQKYGKYAAVVKLFGEAAFIPTSKLRRAPSKPTMLNRSQSFSRRQKENLRREMCELLDTEENYVSKIYDLIYSVAADFRQKAKQKTNASSSPSEQALKGLFPPSIDRILEVNTSFMEAIQSIINNTEDDAIRDIENANDDVFVAPLRGQTDPPDITGAVALAKALVEWFPKFADCYTDYIQAHSEFSQFLKVFMKESGSSFSKRVQDTGEQRLTSMLIEPVQRLPRYNLYIDNIVKQLPVRHPAIKLFLKARDIISEICSHDTPSIQQVKVFDRLRKMVFSWPASFTPQGRLVSAIDFIELSPPYAGELQGPGSSCGIFLLYTDFLVMLHKPNGCNITARSIMADLDNPRFMESFSGNAELIFHQQLKLSDVFVNEHDESRLLQLISPTPSSSQPGRPRSRDRLYPGIRMFFLPGPYEDKVHKFVEEMTKARLEGRFSENERESHKWEVRSVSGDLSLFSAITEDSQGQVVEGRKEPAKVQVVVEPAKCGEHVRLGEGGVEAIVAISPLDDGFFQLDISGTEDYTTRDQLTSAEFLPVLTKRLSNWFQMRNNIRNPALAAAMLYRNQQILKSLKFRIEGAEEDDEHGRGNRPHSPVKMLSNLFGGSINKESGSTRRVQRPQPPSLGEIPRMMPSQPPSRPESQHGEPSRPNSSSRTIGFNTASTALDSLAKLEETLATYVLALNARKGNIVGRSIRARAMADELVVNELYNSLLENPTNHETAAQASVDVLFAAFEKFLRIAWKEKMGPVISQPTLLSMQSKSDSMYPGEFEEFFKVTYNDMAPQNQRSLRDTVKLLANLLDGTGNDGDRGILTAAFAEVLVPEGNPNDFISLLDRFIQDIEVLFAPQHASGLATPNYGSVDSRGRGTNATGSLNSNTSLRKRFGFGTLSRENSRTEADSKVNWLTRQLSKTGHVGESTPNSLSKATHPALGRSNSTDTGRISPKRPSSRDRPTVLGAFNFENGESHSGKSFIGAALGTIGEVSSSSGPPRKKRRSSLSDLKALQSASHTPTWSPQTPRRLDSGFQRGHSRQTSASPKTPSPIKPSGIPTPTKMGTPSRIASPTRKENSPGNALDRPALHRPTTAVKTEEVTIKSYSPHKRRTESVTNIPTLKPTTNTSNINTGSGLSERPASGNTVKIPPPTPRSPQKASASMPSTSPPKKLRMQSPQKIRERLQNEQKAIATTSNDLQAELSAIGHELAKTPRLTTQTSAPTSTTSNKALETRFASIESNIKQSLEALNIRTESIASDLKSSLQVSESRAKKLDELYREANAENEALYARFNDELNKVLRGVKRGNGEDEMQKRLKEQQEETARLKKENQRLKREVLGLRAQLKE